MAFYHTWKQETIITNEIYEIMAQANFDSHHKTYLALAGPHYGHSENLWMLTDVLCELWID